ncbi:MAG: lipopolysaccharide assembly protein LapA domain-containing protein [Candidatus Omnitrophota bacterium]
MKPKNIALVILGVLVLIVLLQNTQVVSVRLLFWELSMSRIILLPLILSIGFIIGVFVGRRSKD